LDRQKEIKKERKSEENREKVGDKYACTKREIYKIERKDGISKDDQQTIAKDKSKN
jgi:hypothetical protein